MKAHLNQGPGLKLFVYLIAVLGALGLFLRRRPASSQTHRLTSEQRRVVNLYRRLLRRMDKFKISHGGLSAEEVRAVLSNDGYAGVADAQALIDTYNEVRFGCRALDSGRYAHLRSAVRGFRRIEKRHRH